jgi:hypothetical protein
MLIKKGIKCLAKKPNWNNDVINQEWFLTAVKMQNLPSFSIVIVTTASYLILIKNGQINVEIANR